MSKISLASNANGTGIFTLASPATNTNRTLTLPDSTGTLLDTNGGTITGTLTVTGVTTLGNGAVLGVPASGTATNLTGLPLTTGVTGTLPTANGGTALTSFTSGGVVYASSASVLATSSNLTHNGTTLTLKNGYYEAYDPADSTSAGYGMRFYTDGGGTKTENGRLAVLQTATSGSLSSMIFQTNNGTSLSEQMRLTSTGLGIGTSSPTVKLDITGYETRLLAPSSGKSISIYADANSSAIGYLSSGYLVFGKTTSTISTQFTEQLRLDSAGNLGLGVTPSAWRTDSGPAKAVQLPGGSVWAYSTSEISLGQNYYYGAGGGRYRLVDGKISNYFQSSGEHYWQTSVTGLAGVAATNIDIMTLDSSGNLGLVVTPSAWGGSFKALQVGLGTSLYNNTSANGTFLGSNFYWNGTNNIYIGTSTATAYAQNGGQHQWFQAASGTAGDAITFTQAMTLDASGNLAIGTTTVNNANSDVLTIGKNSASYDVAAVIRQFANGTAANLQLIAANDTGAAYNFISSSTQGGTQHWRLGGVGGFTGGLAFSTSGSERARIDSSGNLLVGCTATNVTGSIGFRYLGGGRLAITDAASTDATTTYEAYSTGAGAFRFYVGYGGTIFATSITITAISDERLKENVRNIDTGLDSIMALKPRRFDWKEGKGQDKKNVAGFIAQEFEQVFPECVGVSQAGADGIEYKNINHETLIPTLVKAMQEQQALITQLTNRITTLETA